MTRKSKREIERELEDLGAPGEYTLQEWLMASVKSAHDADLSAGERRLLNNPEAHLTAEAKRQYHDWRGSS